MTINCVYLHPLKHHFGTIKQELWIKCSSPLIIGSSIFFLNVAPKNGQQIPTHLSHLETYPHKPRFTHLDKTKQKTLKQQTDCVKSLFHCNHCYIYSRYHLLTWLYWHLCSHTVLTGTLLDDLADVVKCRPLLGRPSQFLHPPLPELWEKKRNQNVRST